MRHSSVTCLFLAAVAVAGMGGACGGHHAAKSAGDAGTQRADSGASHGGSAGHPGQDAGAAPPMQHDAGRMDAGGDSGAPQTTNAMMTDASRADAATDAGDAGSQSADAGDAGNHSADAGDAGNNGADDAGDMPMPDAGPCPTVGPNDDKDHDGWTVAQNDCDDCNALINPGAIDVYHTATASFGDEDCDGTPGTGTSTCDDALALDDGSAADGAKALDVCQATSASGRAWGVIEAKYVRADGSAMTPGLQAGLKGGFGANINPNRGSRLLALSTGHARAAADADACGSTNCSSNLNGTAPPGFPQSVPNCPLSSVINDDAAFEIKLRAPTNATGFAFAFDFYSFEYPNWVCTSFNDQFVVLMNPAPAGAINGNIAFDALGNPVGVNLGFMSVCDPSSSGSFALNCSNGGGTTCPSAPNPYCPSGASQLQGTGFDTWGPAGATGWLTSRAPVHGGDEFTLRFAIWDSGDQSYDSTVLIDSFRWILDQSVAVGTAP